MTASILTNETLQVVNLGASGALVEGTLPLPANGEYRMQLVLESHVSEVIAKVRRVTAIASDGGMLRYRIGLEFLTISPEAEELINQIVMPNQAQI
jgi:c-di-GMP-binding flagellar brake protein YcgR